MTRKLPYETIRKYILNNSFFYDNNLDVFYSDSSKKIFFNESHKKKSKIENKVLSNISPYDELVLGYERELCQEMGKSLVDLKEIEPERDFSYEFKDGGVSLKISS